MCVLRIRGLMQRENRRLCLHNVAFRTMKSVGRRFMGGTSVVQIIFQGPGSSSLNFEGV